MAARQLFRKRFFVDLRVQGALIVRVVLYWLTCLFAIMLVLFAWSLFTGPTRSLNAHLTDVWALCGPASVASLLLLPAVIFDLVRLSNRFAGPMVRLRRSMHDLAHGRPVTKVQFRQTDFWREFADDFNTVAARANKTET